MKTKNIFRILFLGLAIAGFSISNSVGQNLRVYGGPALSIIDNDAFDSESFFGGVIGGTFGASDNVGVGINIAFQSNTRDISLGPFGSQNLKLLQPHLPVTEGTTSMNYLMDLMPVLILTL